MSIVNVLGKGQAPLGAACWTPAAERSRVPLLSELERGVVIAGSYRHGAPDGALARVLRWEMSRLGSERQCPNSIL